MHDIRIIGFSESRKRHIEALLSRLPDELRNAMQLTGGICAIPYTGAYWSDIRQIRLPKNFRDETFYHEIGHHLYHVAKNKLGALPSFKKDSEISEWFAQHFAYYMTHKEK